MSINSIPEIEHHVLPPVTLICHWCGVYAKYSSPIDIKSEVRIMDSEHLACVFRVLKIIMNLMET